LRDTGLGLRREAPQEAFWEIGFNVVSTNSEVSGGAGMLLQTREVVNGNGNGCERVSSQPFENLMILLF
jgi:hypothetical protein